MKQKICIYTIADKKYMPYAKMMINSFKHFHPKIDTKIFTQKDIKQPINYYRSTPMFARSLIKEYDLLVKIDADSIITGSLDYIFNEDYEVGSVFNFNRVDPKNYGIVTVFDIPPNLYMNCGFVAMRSKKFIDHWWQLCNSYHFDNLKYKEQDLLNILLHYGQYNAVCFDSYDEEKNYYAWHGLISKGEWHRMIVKKNELILPKSDYGHPPRDTKIKVMHWAGGKDAQKMNYRIYCNEEVIKYLDKITK